MSKSVAIRHAEPNDLTALTDIYNHYVVNTSITFDMSTFTPEGRQPWFNQFAPATRHQLLVLLEDDAIAGYASSSPLRPKQAYETSIESTIYLHPDAIGKGFGKRLYSTLLEALAAEDIHKCYGIITLPNDASIGLHRSLGFVEVGHLHEVGRKFGTFWDTVWLEKTL